MSYQNPVGNITNIGDPFVLKHSDKYYLYATSLANTGFKVWESDNLVNWTLRGIALDRNHPENKWGKGNFWAPEVVYYNHRFYMTYSATSETGSMKIRVAVSDHPAGPFINWSEPFLKADKYSYIDGNVLVDEGIPYLYFVMIDEDNPKTGKKHFQIMVSQLSNDFKTLVTYPQLALKPSQKWENDVVNEGPFAMKYEDTYYLMYSANGYFDPNYAIGYATAKSPLGPWTKYEQNPILKKNPSLKVSGPGHNSVTTSPDGKEFFIVYHTHTYYNAPSGDRNICIDRLVFENGIMKLLGPTRSKQILPSGALRIRSQEIGDRSKNMGIGD